MCTVFASTVVDYNVVSDFPGNRKYRKRCSSSTWIRINQLRPPGLAGKAALSYSSHIWKRYLYEAEQMCANILHDRLVFVTVDSYLLFCLYVVEST